MIIETIISSRIRNLCYKCKTLRDATRVWNLIDHQEDCESLWAVMADAIPWAFADPSNPNTVKFSY